MLPARALALRHHLSNVLRRHRPLAFVHWLAALALLIAAPVLLAQPAAAQFATTTTVDSSLNPSIYSQEVTFTATVSSPDGTPTGSVTFRRDGNDLATEPLIAGQATLSTDSLIPNSYLAGPNPHPITAVYSGDSNFDPSTSSDLLQDVKLIQTFNQSIVGDINPSVPGQTVTYTVTFTAPGVPQAPANYVFVNALNLATNSDVTICDNMTLVSGNATCTISTLAPGTYTIYMLTDPCLYCDQGYAELAQAQVVNKGATTTAAVADNNPAVPGQSVTFTATVAATAPAVGTRTGNVTFKEGATTLGTGTLSAGVATYSTSALSVGSHTITASYDGDANFSTSTAPDITQIVNKYATTTAVSNTTSVFGQPVTLSATVTSTGGTPGGSVTFKDGGTTLGSGTLSSGVATFQTSALTVGSHTITASYDGSTNFAVSSDASHTHTVNKGATTTTVASNHNPATPGQSVTFTATISVTTPAAGAPGGTVTFKDGATTLGTGNVSGNTATYSTSALSVGNHTITASYGGDASFATSTSSAIPQSVGTHATTTAIASSVNPSTSGQSVTFTATVSSDNGTPTGTVTFNDGAVALGTGTLSGGTASYATTALTVGARAITASYGGDANYAVSTSSALTQNVNKRGTQVELAAPSGSRKPGQKVTLTATMKLTPPATGSVAGDVTFKDGATVLATSSLSGTDATFTTSALTIGTHSITATYAGDATTEESSASANVTIDPKVGAEFRVNTTTANSQQLPAVTKFGTGFVGVWASKQDGSGFGVYGQRFKATDAKAGAEFRVNKITAGVQSAPAVATLTNGFVSVWESNGEDKSGYGIYGQRYTAKGGKAGTEFRVNTTTKSNQNQPVVAGLKGGGFVVAWTSNLQDGAGRGVFAQRYSTAGKAVGKEFRINKTTARNQSLPAIAALNSGGFVIAWQSDERAANGLDIKAQRFTAAGAKSGVEFRVNTVAANAQSVPAMAALSNGGFAVAWQSKSQDGSGSGIYAQRYSARGVKAGAAFLVNTATAMNQSEPTIAGFSNGGFVISWTSNKQDGSGLGVYAQVYSGAGLRENVEFRVNTTIKNNQSQPSVAGFADGNFITVWTSLNQDGSREGVYGQRFRFILK